MRNSAGVPSSVERRDLWACILGLGTGINPLNQPGTEPEPNVPGSGPPGNADLAFAAKAFLRFRSAIFSWDVKARVDPQRFGWRFSLADFATIG
jgi:hypothetical protein